jgi:hypothetical protein
MADTQYEPIGNPPAHQRLLPPPEILDELPSELLTLVADLTPLQQKVLIALCRNTLSETIRTDAEIAAECNTSREYIWQLRQHPKFGRAMGTIIKDLAMGTQDKAFMLLMKHAEKDPGSVKTWLQMGGVYVDRRQNINLNANMSLDRRGGNTGSVEQDCDAMLIRLGELGMTRHDVELLADRFDQLKSEGAF